MTRLAQVSVVIPTFNRQQRLHRVLTGLAQQTIDVEMLEVIVVSDGSTDGTDAYFESRRTPLPVDFVRQANQGPAAARNHGVVRATGDLVLFIDDDVMPDARLVEEQPRASMVRSRGPGRVGSRMPRTSRTDRMAGTTAMISRGRNR